MDFIWQRIYSIIGDWGWNGVSGCTFLCLCLMFGPLHEANSIYKAKIPQKCAMRSRKNTHDFKIFGVVPTPYLPNVWDRGFFRPRVFLWHRVLTISAKMEGILVSHQSTFPCKCQRYGWLLGVHAHELPTPVLHCPKTSTWPKHVF